MNTLQSVTTFASLLTYLGDELDWPVEDYELEELTFDYDPDELGLKDEDAAKIKDGKIRQLRPLSGSQPFGIFFVEFGKKKLPIVVLRRILSQLIIKKRSNAAEAKRWDTSDLLFVSAFGEEGEREVAFAHFHKEPNTSDLPILRVLGWDGLDTPLKLDYVERELRQSLCWPDDTSDQDTWREQWRAAFQHKPRHVINTASALAETLAEFARKIRDAASTIIEHESEEKGHLRRLHHDFRDALIHDLTEEDFADTYAQTVTYGLLTAAVSRTEASAVEDTALTTGNISDMVPVTNPFLKEMLEEFLKAGGRKGGIDFDELGIQDVVELLRDPKRTDLAAVLRDFGNKTQGEDPVIHFYEHFLAAYNKKLRIQRGVFYTPKPVVSFIVRSVHEVLQTEFDLEDGLASTVSWGEMIKKNSDLKLPPLTDEEGETKTISEDEFFVQILDPATGTATFPAEVIDVIHQHLLSKWNKSGLAAMPDLRGYPKEKPILKKFEDYWQHYVPLGLLPRLHAYELMMAPYAIAHMKIGLKLYETGYRFESDERARVYLTNALEPAQDSSGTLAFAIPALAHEAKAVNAVKRNQRFTVVLGNPPYSVSSNNMGSWIVELCEDYKKAVEGSTNIQPLSDDYLKFMRFFQKTIDDTGLGVVGVITNNVFLDGLMHRGVRSQLLDFYSKLSVVNLHGNATIGEQTPSGEKDENVFDIKQGVCVSLFSRKTPSGSTTLSLTDLYGSRLEKYQSLNRGLFGLETVVISPIGPQNFFVEKDFSKQSEYSTFIPLAELMPVHVTGVATHRDSFLVDIDQTLLQQRIETFCGLRVDEVGAQLGLRDTRDWSVSAAKKEVSSFECGNLRPYAYKPFSRHYIYYDQRLIDRGCSRIGIMRSMFEPNLALVVRKKVTDPEWRHVFVTRDVVDFNFYNYISVAFPLHLQGESDELFSGMRSPNLSSRAAAPFSKLYSSQAESATENALGSVPERVLGYFYAIMHSPSFRKRYSDFLKIDFPSIPIPRAQSLAKSLAKAGRELIELHLLEDPTLKLQALNLVGNDPFQVERVSYTDETVWIDKLKTRGFKEVPKEVWNFHIGGYQVCEKWLKDRGPRKGKPGRVLTKEDIVHYHKIVISLTETIRIMKEIDEVIETHGGWPDAFQNESSETSVVST